MPKFESIKRCLCGAEFKADEDTSAHECPPEESSEMETNEPTPVPPMTTVSIGILISL